MRVQATYISIGLIAGIFIGVFLIPMIMGFNAPLTSIAKEYATRITIKVLDVDIAGSYICSPDAPYLKVLHFHTGGVALQTREETDWQLVLGFEDWLTESWEGDYADAIIKITKISAVPAEAKFEVCCLGAAHKQVYFDDVLKLDTATSYYAEWWG